MGMEQETFCIFKAPQLGDTANQPAPHTLTPLLPALTLSLLSQRSARPDTTAPTRTSSSSATATREAATELTVWFVRLPRAPASPQRRNAAFLEERRSTG